MALLTGLMALFIFQGLGEGLYRLLNIPVPGAVLGMFCLVIYLQFNGPIPKTLRTLSMSLTRNLALLFIPAAVGIFFLGDKLELNWLHLLLSILLSTLITFIVCICLWRFIMRHLLTAHKTHE